jgi:hypothetical protein
MKGSASHANLPQPTGVNCVTIYQIGSREQLKTQSRHCHHKSKSIVHLNSTALSTAPLTLPPRSPPTQPTGSPTSVKTEVHPISPPPHSSLAPAQTSLSRTFFPSVHEPETRQRPNGLRACAGGLDLCGHRSSYIWPTTDHPRALKRPPGDIVVHRILYRGERAAKSKDGMFELHALGSRSWVMPDELGSSAKHYTC